MENVMGKQAKTSPEASATKTNRPRRGVVVRMMNKEGTMAKRIFLAWTDLDKKIKKELVKQEQTIQELSQKITKTLTEAEIEDIRRSLGRMYKLGVVRPQFTGTKQLWQISPKQKANGKTNQQRQKQRLCY